DVPPARDVPYVDATQPRDVPCTNGIVIDGVCYTDRCVMQSELGWICPLGNNFLCRSFGNIAYCVPRCAGAMCSTDAGRQYCNPSLGCVSGTPNCATLRCATGQYCDSVRGCVSDPCASVMCIAGTTCDRATGTCGRGTGDGGCHD